MNLKNRQKSKEHWSRVSGESCDSLISTTALFRVESGGPPFDDRPRPSIFRRPSKFERIKLRSSLLHLRHEN